MSIRIDCSKLVSEFKQHEENVCDDGHSHMRHLNTDPNFVLGWGTRPPAVEQTDFGG
jgi:hypothetical protein